MIRNIIVLGGYVNALGVVRQAGRLGLNITVITKKNSNIATYSRYVKSCYYYSTDEEILTILKRNVRDYTMIYPTSDEDVELLDKNKEWLSKMYYLAIPEPEAIEIFAEKSNSYAFADKNNIPYPHSLYLDRNGKINSSQQIQYPIVLKPSVMYDFREKIGKKAFICQDAQELQDKCTIISKAGYPLEKMIIQEYMNGGPKNLYSVGVFAVKGRILKQIQVNRIRQRPMILGNSTTFCEASNIDQIYKLAEKIIELSKYTGVAEVEFMYHNGEYKFLEVNMRSWKWHSISNLYGFSFVEAWVNYFNEEPCKGPKTPQANAAWVDRLTDMIVSIPEIFHGRMKLSDFVKSYFKRKEYAIWAWDDMIPFFVYPVQLARNIFHKK